MISAIFFDVGGTLIRPWPSVGAVYADIARQFRLPADADSMDRAFRQAWKEMKPTTRLTTSEEDWWRQLVHRTLAIQNLDCPPGYFEKLYRAFEQPAAWQIFPETIPALHAARQRARHVGLISNWDSRLRPLLKNLGLIDQFDSITISCEVGAEKPDAHMFQTALQAAGVTPSDAFHIGDSQREDIDGAATLGIGTALVENGLGLLAAVQRT